ncbi:hypothetical protein F5Y10DRAFT_262876 [Nemania abortiva]|nr:hypothetical protein F5Y10DRAFT_262876 [Nemania abortiva]
MAVQLVGIGLDVGAQLSVRSRTARLQSSNKPKMKDKSTKGPMERVYSFLAQRAVNIHIGLKGAPGQGRIVIAFAGPPGYRKSTVAAEVVQQINKIVKRPIATCLPMDGFHYTRAYLGGLPNHVEAHARRGAAWTFDSD